MRMKLWLAFLIGIFLLASCNFPLFRDLPPTAPNPSLPLITLEPAATFTATATEMPHAMDSTEPFQLAILTPAEFVSVLQPLADYKNQTGMPTRIITLEEIYTKCKGRDQAEQVKTCLAQLAQVNGIHYAMLVGDMDKFPVRFTKADRDAPEAGYTAFFPTDLYYADLFKADGSFDNWDSDGDGYYGEICGEITSCPLNSDLVNLTPDIAVGRVPASNEKEVAIYVQKVITYESTAAASTWAKTVLFVATNTWVDGSCKGEDDLAWGLPQGYQTIKLYEEGSPCAATQVLTSEHLIETLNSGVGFVSYIGHGDNTMWWNYLTIKNVMNLTNYSSPAIIFSTGCGTSEFGPRPPADPYLDVSGIQHPGNAAGEVFTEVPPPPANLQADYIDGFGEAMTVQSEGGAVIYIGAITGAQPYSIELNNHFFEALAAGKTTVGDMWMYMVNEYYRFNTFPEYVDPPDWTVLARFHQPWKFMLFGDPSLRVGGVQN